MKRSELFFIFILLPLDIAMIIASFALSFYIRLGIESIPYQATDGAFEYLKYSFYLMPLWILVIALNGLYNTNLGKGFFSSIYRIFVSNSVAVLFLTMLIFFTKTEFFSRLILVFTWVLSILLIVLGRFILKKIQLYLLKYKIGIRHVAIIGTNEVSQFLYDEIRKNPEMGLQVVGVITEEDENLKGFKKLGDLHEIEELIQKYKIDEIVLADSKISKIKIAEIIKVCSNTNTVLKFVPEILSFITLRVNVENIGSMPVLAVKATPLDGWGRITKRIFDFTSALIMLIILSLLFLIFAILEKITSKGPVFYSHERVGRDGKTFMLYKFRSMYLNAEHKVGKYWTDGDANDERITPFGKIIRKTNLDELAQLYNILVGDMSFVGPRPEQPRWVERFSHEVPDYIRRHRVKSGLTGWAQVNGLKGDTSIQDRVRYDNYYIENWSIGFDIKIIIKTIGIILYEIFFGKFEYRDRA